MKLHFFLFVFIFICNYKNLFSQTKNVSSTEFISYITVFHDNGELMIAQKLVENKVVQQESYYPDGVLKERFSIVNGKSHGKGVLYFPSGYVQEKYQFNNGKLIGNHIKYYTNKNLRFIRSYNNKETLSGSGIWFYPFDGSISTEFTYNKNGKIHGIHIEYPKDENNDFLPVVKTYYDNGKVISEEQYNQIKKIR